MTNEKPSKKVPIGRHTECDEGVTINGKKYNNDPRMKLYTVGYKPGKEVKVKSVSLDKDSITLKKGGTKTLKAKIKPSNATNKNVKWKSSDEKVVTVSGKGVVKAKKVGEATITVTTYDGGKKAKCKVKVKKK